MSRPADLSGWLRTGYRRIRDHLGGWVAVSAIVVGAGVVATVIQIVVDGASEEVAEGPSRVLFVAGSALVMLGLQLLQTFLYLGEWRVALAQGEGAPDVRRLASTDVRELASALALLVVLWLAVAAAVLLVVVASLIAVLAGSVAVVVSLVGLLVLLARFQLAPGLVVLGHGAVDALATSFELTRGRTGASVGLLWLGSLGSAAGLLACGVGVLATAPFQVTASAAALRDLLSQEAPRLPVPDESTTPG